MSSKGKNKKPNTLNPYLLSTVYCLLITRPQVAYLEVHYPSIKILEDIEKMPVPPQIARCLIFWLNTYPPNISDVVDVVSFDHELSDNVLLFANSIFKNGSEQSYTTIENVVSMLGLGVSSGLVLIPFAYDLMKESLMGYACNSTDLWEHSILCAMCCDAIAKRTLPGLGGLVFIAGLFHDIGKLVLDKYIDEKYDHIVESDEYSNMPFVNVERYISGITHPELSALILRHWGVLQVVVNAVEYHHSLEDCREDDLTAIVHLADTMCLMLGVKLGMDGMCYVFRRDVVSQLGLSEKELFDIMKEMPEKLSIVKRLFV